MLKLDSPQPCMDIHEVAAIAVAATSVHLDMSMYEGIVTQQHLPTQPCLLAP